MRPGLNDLSVKQGASEPLAMTTDTLLAQSAVARLTSGAHTLIIADLFHRQRQRVAVDDRSQARDAH